MLKLLFLGRLEDTAGEAERQVPFASSLGEVLARLDPALSGAVGAERSKLAFNGTLVADRGGLVLKDGDELALLPPVSGGGRPPAGGALRPARRTG